MCLHGVFEILIWGEVVGGQERVQWVWINDQSEAEVGSHDVKGWWQRVNRGLSPQGAGSCHHAPCDLHGRRILERSLLNQDLLDSSTQLGAVESETIFSRLDGGHLPIIFFYEDRGRILKQSFLALTANHRTSQGDGQDDLCPGILLLTQ